MALACFKALMRSVICSPMPDSFVYRRWLKFQKFLMVSSTNESGIGEQITERINALKQAKAIEEESYYGTNKTYDLDSYDDEGYTRLVKDEEFDPGFDEEDV